MKQVKELIMILLVFTLFVIAGCKASPLTGEELLDYTVSSESSSSIEGDSIDNLKSEADLVLATIETADLEDMYESSDITDCGVYIRTSELSKGNYVDVYKCFSTALNQCEEAKAFFNVENAKSAQVVSFLTTKNCTIVTHVRGNDPRGYSGDEKLTCDEINTDLALQYACVGYV